MLGDFGIAKVLDSTQDLAKTCIGTPYYMSPELFKYEPYDFKSDIWSLGCCLYEICTFKHAFDAKSFQALAVKILKGNYNKISGRYSKELKKLIYSLMKVEPENRPSMIQIFKIPKVQIETIKYVNKIIASKSKDVS